jgi:hypothetical protein
MLYLIEKREIEKKKSKKIMIFYLYLAESETIESEVKKIENEDLPDF